MEQIKNIDVPVVLFLFKRIDKPLRIIEQLKKMNVKKIYILSDGGRNPEECELVSKCRIEAEAAIDWDCEIIRRYSDKNIGVYQNIGNGARWVFEREEFAIFLEDDNLPEITFYDFCKELLVRYKDDERILWICGTNYLGKFESGRASYFFTQHMMPCGWASWSKKFNKYYDGDLASWNDKEAQKKFKQAYKSYRLYRQDRYNLDYEIDHFAEYGRFYSWDYQMIFSLRVNNLFGIVPRFNQIKNIGADENSIHGGGDLSDIMTQRFCNIETFPLDAPLISPSSFSIEPILEKKIENIVLNPAFFSFRSISSRFVRRIFRINKTKAISHWLRSKLKDHN